MIFMKINLTIYNRVVDRHLLISFDDYVNDLTDDEFDSLIKSINKRIDKKKYGETNFEDLAIKYGRKPVCPKCESKNYSNDVYTSAYHSRYRCKDCDCSYTLLSN